MEDDNNQDSIGTGHSQLLAYNSSTVQRLPSFSQGFGSISVNPILEEYQYDPLNMAKAPTDHVLFTRYTITPHSSPSNQKSYIRQMGVMIISKYPHDDDTKQVFKGITKGLAISALKMSDKRDLRSDQLSEDQERRDWAEFCHEQSYNACDLYNKTSNPPALYLSQGYLEPDSLWEGYIRDSGRSVGYGAYPQSRVQSVYGGKKPKNIP
jgi:hypothetical protein